MKITSLIALIMLLGIGLSCTANANKEENKKEEIRQAETVEVYYFHNTRRCATCKAVESVTKKAVETMENEKVSFTELNLEKPEGEKKAKELGISGQTLLIVCGDKKVNITQKGFMYARSKPEKLKEIVLEKVNELL
jgi:hypothetical protein